MKNIVAFILGTLFSLGLVFSQMVNPEKVIGFLDILGNWDYSLLFVMGGAVGVNLILFPQVLKRKPILSEIFHLPTKKDIDKDLTLGAILFGLGWGLVGICPGPAIVNLSRGDSKSIVFIVAMIGGMYLYTIVEKWRVK